MVKFILSCDGGGIRGTIIAQFLKRLGEHVNIYEKFDMFAGTSTGSFIIAGIVYKKMTGKYLSDTMYSYENAKILMKKSIKDKILGNFQCEPKYTNSGIKRVLSEQIPDNPLICETEKDVLITAFDIERFKPKVFKSFKDTGVKLEDALLMSSAAPGFFPAHNNEEMWGLDGGIFANDPADCAYSEALRIYGKDEDIRIISIGTGYNNPVYKGKRVAGYGGIEWMTKGDIVNLFFKAPQRSVNYKMKTFTEALGHKYLRINTEISNSCMDDVSEDNIKELKRIGDIMWEEYKEEIISIMKV